MTNKQPDALEVADDIEGYSCCTLGPKMDKAAALLRTQHAAIERKDELLLDALSALRHLGGWSTATHRIADAITKELAK